MEPDENLGQPGQPTNQPENQDAAPATGLESSAPPEQSGFDTLLSSLTEGGAPADDQAAGADSLPAGQLRDAHGRFASQSPSEPAAASATPADTQQPGQPQLPTAPRTPEQEDADLLAGIKSDRGRARVQEIIEARRQAEGSVSAIRDLVSGAGMTPETFSQHIEFARLLNSGDQRDLETAAQMIEDVRADVYRRLGRDGPALDALAAYPDLAQRVQNLELPRETALEVARMRRHAADDDAQRQAQASQQRQAVQFQQDIAAAQQSLESYVSSRQHEVDHPARMRAVADYFANQRNLQDFARTYQPHQWPAAVRMLYDNVRVAPSRQPSPISSRPASTGRPTLPANAAGEDQIMRMVENMGLV
ncbi:hypothetical protein [Castellaniella caeni]|uniref:hypothetical protein n=1 Tax=Castellaniella caeni TaxID=266123 RepID=UPI000C9F9ED3|nr:hypothetical protein [Castellaniella caeni]